MSDLPYRPCAGVMLLNRDGRVFVGQRLDSTMEAWQMPQGGIDPGEDARETALRELGEETGIAPDHVEFIAEAPGEFVYDLPDDLIGKVKGINLEVIIAVGHTDSVGSDAYNQKLSVKRSEAVKAYLVSKGVEKNRVYTEGKGEKQPVASNKTKDGRAKNRRVEIEVVGTRANK